MLEFHKEEKQGIREHLYIFYFGGIWNIEFPTEIYVSVLLQQHQYSILGILLRATDQGQAHIGTHMPNRVGHAVTQMHKITIDSHPMDFPSLNKNLNGPCAIQSGEPLSEIHLSGRAAPISLCIG